MTTVMNPYVKEINELRTKLKEVRPVCTTSQQNSVDLYLEVLDDTEKCFTDEEHRRRERRINAGLVGDVIHIRESLAKLVKELSNLPDNKNETK
jgi:hypothetical protein